MNNIIEFINISKKYDKDYIIKDFNLKINEGAFLCIVGTSGSGKTTILKMINKLILPDDGQILINNKDIKNEDIIALRRKIGYSIQGNVLFPHLNVYENTTYVLKLEKKSQREIDKIFLEKLNLVNLNLDIKNKYPHELSGGQQQRVGIARSYANNPKILLMDEPFGAIDSITRNQLQKEIKEIHNKTNCTIIFITHDINEAFKLATHILVMDNEKIVQYGTKEEIKENPKDGFVKNLINSI